MLLNKTKCNAKYFAITNLTESKIIREGGGELDGENSFQHST
jgi:hypothetical protein